MTSRGELLFIVVGVWMSGKKVARNVMKKLGLDEMDRISKAS